MGFGTNFNIGDIGYPLDFYPEELSGSGMVPFPIPSGATNLEYAFYGITTQAKVVASTGVSSQNGGQFARYLKVANDFTVPDTYQWQFSYVNGDTSFSSDAPHPTVTVGQRLANL